MTVAPKDTNDIPEGYEENYKPWKKLIGTPKYKLKLIELDNVGHGLPWDTIIKHHSNWIKAHTSN